MKAGRLFAAALCVLTVAGAAYAGTIQINWDIRYIITVELWRDRTVYRESAGLGGAVASVMDMPGLSRTFDTYCVDLLHSGTANDLVEVPVIKLMSDWKQTNVPEGHIDATPPGWPWANNLDAGTKAAYLYNTFAGFAHGDIDRQSGLQLAIWEVLYEGAPGGVLNFDLSGGNVKFTGSGVDLPLYWGGEFLKSVTGSSWVGADAIWLATADELNGGLQSAKQDYIAPIPEPPTLLLIGGGLVLLGGFALKKNLH